MTRCSTRRSPASTPRPKELIAAIQGMKSDLGQLRRDRRQARRGDQTSYVLEEREQIFLEAQRAPLDLRGLAVPLYQRKKELTAAADKRSRPAKEKA